MKQQHLTFILVIILYFCSAINHIDFAIKWPHNLTNLIKKTHSLQVTISVLRPVTSTNSGPYHINKADSLTPLYRAKTMSDALCSSFANRSVKLHYFTSKCKVLLIFSADLIFVSPTNVYVLTVWINHKIGSW